MSLRTDSEGRVSYFTWSRWREDATALGRADRPMFGSWSLGTSSFLHYKVKYMQLSSSNPAITRNGVTKHTMWSRSNIWRDNTRLRLDCLLRTFVFLAIRSVALTQAKLSRDMRRRTHKRTFPCFTSILPSNGSGLLFLPRLPGGAPNLHLQAPSHFCSTFYDLHWLATLHSCQWPSSSRLVHLQKYLCRGSGHALRFQHLPHWPTSHWPCLSIQTLCLLIISHDYHVQVLNPVRW